MNQPTIREIQLELLRMLKIVVEILDKHKIPYYLSGGSVLGAVRHQGFIPRDDDIDIMVYREDYERLGKLFRDNLPNCLTFQSFETCTEFPYVFSRVVLKNSAIVFRGREHLSYHHGIHIDVQPIDRVPPGKRFRQFAVIVKACKTLLDIRYLSTRKDGRKRPLHQRLIILIIRKILTKRPVHELC